MSERHNVVRFAQKCRFCDDRHEVWQLCGLLPPLGGRQYAQAMSAGTAKTEGLGGDSPASAVSQDAPDTPLSTPLPSGSIER